MQLLRSMKPWLEENNIEMYSTHNEGESVVVEKFIRTLKNKIYKYMTSISYKNTHTHTHIYIYIYIYKIKMKPVDVKSSMYIDFNREIKKECPKFQVGDHVRIKKS